jgi:hypothetical protein
MRKSVWLLLIVAMGCASKGTQLEKATFGESWPLTVESCHVNCVGEFAVVIYANNKTYAVNDAARAMEQFEDVNEITLNDPNYPGANLKMSLSDIEFEGLKLCDTP